jgi:hypothetical protein
MVHEHFGSAMYGAVRLPRRANSFIYFVFQGVPHSFT